MKVTGSSLPLLRKCQWWARPEVEAPPQMPPSEAMLLGTAVHEAVEKTLLGQAVALTSPEASDLYRTWLEWWATSPLGKGIWEPEVAYAYDPYADAARRLGKSVARRYTVDVNEIAGTVDAVTVNGTGALVIDWKTGMDFAGMTADAADNWQMRLYALAVSRTHKVDSVTIAIVRITPYGVRHTEHTLDAFELDAVAEEVKALMQAAPKSQPQPGLHCQRCKAVSACPTTATASEALTKMEQVTLEIQSPEQASAALVRLRQVQAACEQMEALLKLYADTHEGIKLPSGKRWLKVPQERESINLSGPEMAAGISALSAAGVDDAVETKATTTKAAIERSLKSKGLKGKELRTATENLLSELRAAGVVRSVTVEAWREVE